MKQIKIIRLTLLLLSLSMLFSCSEWNQVEVVDNKVTKPWEQDPVLWAQYTAALRAYKKSDHFIAYARLNNSPEKSPREQNFMRCLPDSLDIVSLTNADNFSAYDQQDLAVMREKDIKVLYQIDYARRGEEFADLAKLGAYLDLVIATLHEIKLDGYSFTGIPMIGDPATEAAAKMIVEKLSAAKTSGQLLVFEGNPLFIAEADRAKIDYFVLDTELTADVLNVRLQVLSALDYAKVPAAKLLLAAEAGAGVIDEKNKEFAALDELSRRVISFGPLAGLAAYNIGQDYYHSDLNYKVIRTAIQTMNPSK